ncbi:MAG: fused MFS/spermidine synthase [Actinomycetota bacterium]|nr:fused MFS/spermidine synthase [Actinomycetota bacterium]
MNPPARTVKALVFVVGAAGLGAEIAAARLLAPWFGASTIVWANTIATVLVALSIGYALGGRVADRNPTIGGLSRLVLVSSVPLAIVPFAAGPFLRLSVQAFAHLSIGVFLGSLVGVSVLIAVPLLLLGMVSPYAVRVSVQRVEDAGRTAGRLYAISTAGALVGTFLAALLLIPVVGTRRTFLLFAAALALVALPGLTRRLAASVVPALILALLLLPVGTLKPETSAGDRVIWERETQYQYARVIQAPDGERSLELNEGQAVHSLFRPGSYLVGGYWDDMLAATQAAARRPRAVAILGSAAGTTARAIGHYFPATRVDAVEIDPALTAVGRELFNLRGPQLHTYAADARPWLRDSSGGFDAILVDAYRQPYIPFYLATREFFALTRARLAAGGVVAVNVGHPSGSTALEKVLSATMAAVFGRSHVWRDPVNETNTVLLATTVGNPAARMRRPGYAPGLAAVVDGAAGRLSQPLAGGTVYTDDRAPVEWLIDASLAQVGENH